MINKIFLKKTIKIFIFIFIIVLFWQIPKFEVFAACDTYGCRSLGAANYCMGYTGTSCDLFDDTYIGLAPAPKANCGGCPDPSNPYCMYLEVWSLPCGTCCWGGEGSSEKPRCALVSATPDVALGNTLDITTFIDSPDECFWEVRDDYCSPNKFGIGTQRTYEELDGTDACGYIERVGFTTGQVYEDFCNGNICDKNGCDSNCGSSGWACRTYLYRFYPGTQPGRCKINLRVCNDDGSGECSIVINVLSQPCGPCIPSGCGHSAFFIDERFAKEGKEIAISSEPASCGENKVLAKTQDKKPEPTILSINAFETKPEPKGFFARTEIFLANILEQVKSFFRIVFKSIKELTLTK